MAVTLEYLWMEKNGKEPPLRYGTYDSVDQLHPQLSFKQPTSNGMRGEKLIYTKYQPNGIRDGEFELVTDKPYFVLRMSGLSYYGEVFQFYNLHEYSLLSRKESYGYYYPLYKCIYRINLFATFAYKLFHNISLPFYTNMTGRQIYSSPIKIKRTNGVKKGLYKGNTRDPLLDFKDMPYVKVRTLNVPDLEDRKQYFDEYRPIKVGFGRGAGYDGSKGIPEIDTASMSEEGNGKGDDRTLNPTRLVNCYLSCFGNKEEPTDPEFVPLVKDFHTSDKGIEGYIGKGKVGNYICIPSNFTIGTYATNFRGIDLSSSSTADPNPERKRWGKELKLLDSPYAIKYSKFKKNYELSHEYIPYPNYKIFKEIISFTAPDFRFKDYIEQRIMRAFPEGNDQQNFVGIFKSPSLGNAGIGVILDFKDTETAYGNCAALIIDAKVLENLQNGGDLRNASISLPFPTADFKIQVERFSVEDIIYKTGDLNYAINSFGDQSTGQNKNILIYPRELFRQGIGNDSDRIMFDWDFKKKFFKEEKISLNNSGFAYSIKNSEGLTAQVGPESGKYYFNSYDQYLSSIKNTTNTGLEVAKQQSIFAKKQNLIDTGFGMATSVIGGIGSGSIAGALNGILNAAHTAMSGELNKARIEYDYKSNVMQTRARIEDAKASHPVQIFNSNQRNILKIAAHEMERENNYLGLNTYPLGIGTAMTIGGDDKLLNMINADDLCPIPDGYDINKNQGLTSDLCVNSNLVQIPIFSNPLNFYTNIIGNNGVYINELVYPSDIKELLKGEVINYNNVWTIDNLDNSFEEGNGKIRGYNTILAQSGIKMGGNAPFWYVEMEIPEDMMAMCLPEVPPEGRKTLKNFLETGVRMGFDYSFTPHNFYQPYKLTYHKQTVALTKDKKTKKEKKCSSTEKKSS